MNERAPAAELWRQAASVAVNAEVSTVARLALFVLACVLTGLGALLGSIAGNAFGRSGLFAGGVLGGVLAALLVPRIAAWRRWIAKHQVWPTAFGTALGFLAAAAVAVNTLSSPLGPILSTTLAGVGAVVGAARADRARKDSDHAA